MAPFLGPLEVKTINKSLENGPIESNAHVVVAFDVLKSQNKLNHLAETVKDGGFVITSEINNISQSLMENSDLIFISKLSADDRTFYLLRKVCLNCSTLTYYLIMSHLIVLLNFNYKHTLLYIIYVFFLNYCLI